MITTKTMAARRASIRVTYMTKETSSFSRLSIALSVCACMALVFTFFFLGNAHEEAREEYIAKLKAEKQVVETNRSLKMELAAITQKGYLEFAARERLGLKRPTEEEVVVLR
jgi:cell division protein FtsL